MNPLLIILIVCRFLTSGQAFGTELVCPDKFHNGPKTVTCKINTTAIQAANCRFAHRSVTFDRTVNSQTTGVCMYNYDPTQPCIRETQHTAGKCWCSQASGEVITYNFTYIANSTLDEGGQLECKLCILPVNPLDVQVSKGCRNMTFASIQESQKTDSSKMQHDGEEQPVTLPLAVGISVGIIAIIILMTVMILYKKGHFHRYSRGPPNGPENETRLQLTPISGLQCEVEPMINARQQSVSWVMP